MFIFIALPLLMAGIMPLLGKTSKKLPDFLSCAVMLVLCLYAALQPLLYSCVNGNWLETVRLAGTPTSINLLFDNLSGLMLFMIGLLGFLVCLFSVDYMEKYGSKGNYYSLLFLMTAGMNGLVLSTDLFNVYVFLEITALASYGLVAFGLGRKALEGAFKYLMLSAVGSGLILLSITLIFGFTSGLSFSAVRDGFQALNNPFATGLCVALFLAGFGLKTGLVPFHAWMPDAYADAPATLPAISSGLIIKVSGVYAMARIFFNVFGRTMAFVPMIYLGMISIVAGAILALGQNNLKRMLAYSSISQVGYIVAGLGTGMPLGIIAGIFHLFNHSMFKPLLFLNAGAIENATGTVNLDEMEGGLGRNMPVTATTSTIASLAAAGVPPLNGFWSKLLIVMALIQLRMFFFAFIAIFISVLTLWYLLLFQRRTFFGKPSAKWEKVTEASSWMRVPMITLAIICILTGLAFPLFLRTWIEPASWPLMSGLTNGILMHR